ncbi:nuclear transport factor 2 family protein [Williamsia muralis]|uniref:nuclear transport factor 2 family protein n=1 Tax=Williamsia marianensis TaxID=85044 RepID=UPI00382868DB
MTADIHIDAAALVSRYLSTVSAGSATQIASLYAIDARLEDPVGSNPRIGRTEIEDFYRGLDGANTTAELLVVHAVGYEAAFHFRITTRLADRVVTVEPIDVMRFNDLGLIASMRAFWTADVIT